MQPVCETISIQALNNVEHGYYPSTLDESNCPATPTADNGYCLKVSNGNELTYTGSGQTFTLTDTHISTGLAYRITENTTAVAISNSETATSFVRLWGGVNPDVASSIAQTSDGGYVITGYTGSYGTGGTDIFLAKYTSDGTLSWNKTWGGTSDDYAYGIAQTSDGGYVIAGSSNSFDGAKEPVSVGDALLAKYTPDGAISGCAGCESPSAGNSSPSVSVSSPSASVSSPSATVNTPTATVTSPDAISTPPLVHNLQ